MTPIVGVVKSVSFNCGKCEGLLYLGVKVDGTENPQLQQTLCLFIMHEATEITVDEYDFKPRELLRHLLENKCRVKFHPDPHRYGAGYKAEFTTIKE